MGYVLSAGYAEVYEKYLAWEQPRISKAAYVSIKSLAYLVLKWFETEDIPLHEAVIQDIIRYKQNLSEQVRPDGRLLSTGAVCNYLKAGKRIFRYLVLQEQRTSNPFEEVRYPRLPKPLGHNVLNEVQMNRLLETLHWYDDLPTIPERLERYRAHVMAELLYATGLRIAEAANLRPEHIDIKQRQVYVDQGKGSKARIAFLTSYAAEVMKLYLLRGRPILLARGWRKNAGRVFGGDKATISNAVSKELRQVCTELELPVVTCHAFRHSLGTHLLRAGCDMRHIQAILGHEQLSSTQRYTWIDKDDLKNSIDRYHPRQWNSREGV
jgi:integrase/recombinase XerD